MVRDHKTPQAGPSGRLYRCTVCQTLKPAEEFSKDDSARSGLMSRCKTCDNALQKDRRDDTTSTTPEERAKQRARLVKALGEPARKALAAQRRARAKAERAAALEAAKATMAQRRAAWGA